MAKRMTIMLISVAVFLTGIGLVKYTQIRAAIAQGKSYSPPPAAVTTVVAKQETWRTTLRAIGTITAVQGVELSADLPGVVARIEFESGQHVHKGDVLVRLDTSQEQAQLAAAQSRLRLAKLQLERMRGLRDKGVISQAEFDRTDAEATQNEAQVNEVSATIERKTIRAPFSGIIGLREVNLGQYVKAGEPIAPLQSLDPVYADFAVPQQSMSDLHVGSEITVSNEGAKGATFKGRLSAINSVIDRSTRNVQVQATLPNPEGKLLPGMFVEVHVDVGKSSEVVALPTSAIGYAPYGDYVYIVEEVKPESGDSYLGVRQQFVKLGDERGDQVAIIKGLESGQEVVSSGVFKLRNNAAVQVSNDVQPANNPAPDPEDS